MPKRVRAEVEIRLSELAAEHRDWTPRLLAEAINNEFAQADVDTGPAVSERWIRDKLPRLRDRSDFWTLRPGERDVAFVFKVLGGVPGRLTVDEVAWIRVVHEAAPYLSPADALRVSRLYMATDKIENGAVMAGLLDSTLASGFVPGGDPATWLRQPPNDIVEFDEPKEV